jgi:hypothetical protein
MYRNAGLRGHIFQGEKSIMTRVNDATTTHQFKVENLRTARHCEADDCSLGEKKLAASKEHC